MMIDLVMKPFRQLNFSTTEFALLQAIMFFDPDTEGLDSASQRNVVAEQKKLLAVLFRHLQKAYNPQAASERYASIILRMPSIRVRVELSICLIKKFYKYFREPLQKRMNHCKCWICFKCMKLIL